MIALAPEEVEGQLEGALLLLSDERQASVAVVEVQHDVRVVLPHRGHPRARRVEEPQRRHAVAPGDRQRERISIISLNGSPDVMVQVLATAILQCFFS